MSYNPRSTARPIVERKGNGTYCRLLGFENRQSNHLRQYWSLLILLNRMIPIRGGGGSFQRSLPSSFVSNEVRRMSKNLLQRKLGTFACVVYFLLFYVVAVVVVVVVFFVLFVSSKSKTLRFCQVKAKKKSHRRVIQIYDSIGVVWYVWINISLFSLSSLWARIGERDQNMTARDCENP